MFIQAQIKGNIKAPHHWALCAGISPVTGDFPAQMASNVEIVSIWWRHHEIEAWTKCQILQTFSSVPFKMKCSLFDLTCFEFCSGPPNWQYTGIDLFNG